jgi:ABC-type antimicrobial peptide transport system permease subunit
MYKNYFKIAWRNLTKRKGFSLINIIGLALGFACSILIFLFVGHHLSYDTFHKNPERIYRFVTEEHRDFIDYEASVPPGFANAFKSDYDYAELVAKIADREQYLIAIEEHSEVKKLKEDVYFVEPDFFKIFNFPLVDEKGQVQLSEPNTAIITESMAKKMFGDENPINKTFQLENKEFIRVTGVLRDLPKTTLFNTADIFISFETLPSYDSFLGGESWGGISSNLQCFGLLQPNQNISLIEGTLQGYVKKYRPDSKNVHHYKLQPFSDIHLNSQYNGGIDVKVLWIFSFIGFFILMIAAINFINISTAQSVNRSKEVGVRKVLGGQKNQLFWQFMTETFVISLLALLLGVGLSMLALPYFNSIFDLELSISGIFNVPFLVFVCVLLCCVSVLAGSYPGFILAGIAPILALKRKLTQKDAGGYTTRKILVITQFVISIVLIIGTIVVSRQIRYAVNSDLGFDKSAIVMVELPSELDRVQMDGLKERLLQSPSVEKISACFASPGAGNTSWTTYVRYNNNPEPEEFLISAKVGDEDYLNTFGLDLLAGRNFYIKDTVDEILVNATFAKKLGLPSVEELLGKRVDIAGELVKGSIVGVVADFHDQDFHDNIQPIFIAPFDKVYSELAIKINLRNAKESLIHIEDQWTNTFPNYIFSYDFLDARVAEMYVSEQRFLSLAKLFSTLAIFIGCLGIYGLILFFVTQRTKEIGIRKVLGGSVNQMVVLVIQDFFKLIVLAGIIAAPIAWYIMGTWLESYTYKIKISWWIYLVAIGLVMAITLLTILYQAVKAAMADPAKSLRTE